MINLYNGDCLEIMDKLIADGVKVDAIITDPPYKIPNTTAGGKSSLAKSMQHMNNEIKKAGLTKGYDIEVFGEKAVKLMDKINIYFWCNKLQIPDYFDFWVRKQKCKFDIISWHKTNAMPTFSNKYLSDTEYCLYFRKNAYCKPSCYDDAKTFCFEPINVKDKKQFKHPTIKPLEMIMKSVRNSTRENQTILDPFMGSGTTGVACKKLNRNFIGIELDMDYFLTACERIGQTEL